MIVCIAEKPSVARDIADVLGAKDKKDGYIEGNGYQVTWTFGHLCTLTQLEVVEFGQPAYGSAPFRHQAYQQPYLRTPVPRNREPHAACRHDYKLR